MRRGHGNEPVAALTDLVEHFHAGPDGALVIAHRFDWQKKRLTRAATVLFPDAREEIAIHRADIPTLMIVDAFYAAGYLWGSGSTENSRSEEFAYRIDFSAILALYRSKSRVPKQ